MDFLPPFGGEVVVAVTDKEVVVIIGLYENG